MNSKTLRSLVSASAILLVAGCETIPEAPPAGRSLDQPPSRQPNRYMQGTEYLPERRPHVPQNQVPEPPRDPNALYAPPEPPPSQPDPSPVSPDSPPPGGPPSEPAPGPTDPASPPPPPPGPDQIPFGIKVEGKSGFVLSPFDKSAGIVDVQGIAPGKKVKCPYTGKVFLVP